LARTPLKALTKGIDTCAASVRTFRARAAIGPAFSMARRRTLIIGDGAAGTTAAQYVRQADPNGLVTILSDDPNPAYFRAALTNYLLGELREEQIWAVPPTFYGEFAIQRVLTRVAAVDTARGYVHMTSGPPEGYDQLLIAAGARARPPAWDGAWLPGVMTMRTLQDVRRVMELISSRGLQRALVVGGGPLALEWAAGMRARGVAVTMIIREAKFLPGALDSVGSDLLLARLRHAGVDVRVGEEISAVMPGRDGRAAAVVTKSGQTIPCELVAAAIGVICNSDFLQGSGVALGKSGGVVVSDRLRTSVPNVYAAGDIAELGGRLLQLWEPARRQGRTAATNMTGGDEAYAPGVHYMATRLYDLDFASLGTTTTPAGAEEIVDYPRHTGSISYKKLVIQNGRLIGALLLGEREEKVRARGRAFKRLIDEGRDVGVIKGLLLDPSFDVAGWLNTTGLTQKPENASAHAELPVQGKMRGTQAINLSALAPANAKAPVLAKPATPLGAGTALVPNQPAKKLAFGTMVLTDIPPSVSAPSDAAATATPAWLEAGGRRWDLGAPTSSVGRDPRSAIAIDEPSVSHVHAQITRHGEELYVRDLGTSTGTWVNGKPVTVPHRLREGDRLRFGNVELLFRSPGGRKATAIPESQAAGGERRAHLDVRAGHGLGLSFLLAQPTITIGRDPASVIRLDDYSVAWNHGLLREHGGRYWLQDLGQSEGVWRNGQRLPPRQDVMLEENDVLRFGGAELAFVTKVVLIRASMPPPAPAPAPAINPVAAMQAIVACARCGVPLTPQATFCTSCGAPAQAGMAR
jgi:NADPH-dependent 2,4-dienoyl-CoA reductase/sulfur reductase-like enzyme/pSer/pThr/pTyr-binding forkhead associated (FHA) protein